MTSPASHDARTGYTHPAYATSLAEFGVPLGLPRSGGWLLERGIPKGGASRDAIGCYPIFACRDWSPLGEDLDELSGRIVSLFVVPDPFCPLAPTDLERLFPDLARPYKEHHVVEMRKPLEITRHHRKCARQARRRVSVEVHSEGAPPGFLEQWLSLHRHLVERHSISGIQAFSDTAFERQLLVPGLVVVRALHAETTVGAQLWFVHGDVAYGHVLALDPNGYQFGAAYAMYQTALEYFTDRVAWCDLGGVPGVEEGGAKNLESFKRGWSKATRTTFACGRVFDRERYLALVSARGVTRSTFFPRYRDRL